MRSRAFRRHKTHAKMWRRLKEDRNQHYNDLTWKDVEISVMRGDVNNGQCRSNAMTGNDDKEWTIELSDEVKEQMKEDPKMAEAIREFSALMRQALHGTETGQYKTLDDAVESLIGSRPQKIDPETDEVMQDASLHEDAGFDSDEDDDNEPSHIVIGSVRKEE